MWGHKDCAYGILPGTFPLSVLAAMQADLTAAQQLATNWWIIDRVNDMTNEFNWVIANAGLYGVNLTNTAPYPMIGSTTNTYTVNLTNMVPFTPGYSVIGQALSLQSGPTAWWFGYFGQIKETFNVTEAGTYNVAVTASRVVTTSPVTASYVYFGPKSSSMFVNSTNDTTYNFTFTVPSGVWDFEIIGCRCVIDNIQITRQ